jgi:hypothetical protein
VFDQRHFASPERRRDQYARLGGNR